MLNQVVHANGVTVTHGKDPNDMLRPASIATTGAATNWSTGTYLYDGARSMRDPGTGETPACPVFVDGQKFTTLKGSYEELALALQKLIDEYVATKYPRRAGA